MCAALEFEAVGDFVASCGQAKLEAFEDGDLNLLWISRVLRPSISGGGTKPDDKVEGVESLHMMTFKTYPAFSCFSAFLALWSQAISPALLLLAPDSTDAFAAALEMLNVAQFFETASLKGMISAIRTIFPKIVRTNF